MILVDTSIWVDHFRQGDTQLVELLEAGQVLCHPFVVGELALGNLRQRDIVVSALKDLPSATVAAEDEVLRFIAGHALHGRGIGYVDAHLLASVRLTAEASILTRDKPLLRVARSLGLIAGRA